MEKLEILQAYWWLIISVLGALLVFLLFVQGGQSMLWRKCSEADKQLMVNSLGRKWEFTYTTLVVFGGAFFASFPLFYSTSFGGAYWLWMLILVSFVLQAVSYEFRSKKGNVYGTKVYDIFLSFNGLFGCVLLGVAVGTFFFGGEFTVNRVNILDPSAPVISRWVSTHGLEAIADYRNLLLGFVIFFLARTLASLYFVNNIKADETFDTAMRRSTFFNGVDFTVVFLAFLVILLFTGGYRVVGGQLQSEDHIYLHNLIGMWPLALLFLAGVVAVLYGIFRTVLSGVWRKGIWFAGFGTVAVVLVLFLIAGYGGTSYLPSTLDPQSSLTIANSSSSEFTLTVMTWVSVLIPFVLGYIWYVWSKMNATPLTEEELSKESHKY